MSRRIGVVVAIAIAAFLAGWLTAPLVEAWGDGTLCWQGQVYTFPDEASYYAFLDSHPGATEGSTDCTEVPPSTSSPSPTSSPSSSTSSTTSATDLTVPTTSGPAPSSTAAPSVTSVTPSTPNSETTTTVPAVGVPACLPETICDASATTTSTPTPDASSASTPQPPGTPPSDSSTPSTGLAATGPDWLNEFAVAAVLIVCAGIGAALLARRRP